MDGALAGDHPDPLLLLGAEALRQAQGDGERRVGTAPVNSISTSTSTSPTSHSLRSAYISRVIAVQAAREAASTLVGEGPSSAPPLAGGSSMTSVWPPSISTSWV